MKNTIPGINRGIRHSFALILVLFMSVNSSYSAANITHEYLNSTQLKSIDLLLLDNNLEKTFQLLEKKTNLKFSYDRKDLDKELKLTKEFKNATLDQVLSYMSSVSSLEFKIIGKTINVVKRTPKINNATQRTIKGTVLDPNGTPIPGVNILEVGTTNGVTTDFEGNFILNLISFRPKLRISYIGYQTLEIEVQNKTQIEVMLKEDVQSLEGVVVTAFGQRQKKSDLVGSVTSIAPEELKIPVSNLTAAVQGRIAGMVSFQRSGEPGLDDADFFIRGVGTFGVNNRPLILVDNVEVSAADLARIPWDDLESFSVLKDATAAAVYGSRAANGVILVTTKLGKEGPPKINLRLEQRLSMPTKNLDIADPVTFMKMNREAILTRDPLDRDNQNVYSLEKIDKTAAGIDPILYPAVDWLGFITKKVTNTQNYNVGISGGGEVATYNVSGNLTTDEGLLKLESINDFNSNVRFKVYNLRSNIQVKLAENTRLTVRALANIQDYNGPPSSGSAAYNNALHSNPVLFQPIYTPPPSMSYITHPMFGNYQEGGYLNAYAEIVKGYSERKRSNLSFQVELNQDLSFITEGLSYRGLFNITRNSYFEQSRVYNPFYYTPSVNPNTGKVDSFLAINPTTGTEFLNFEAGRRDQSAVAYAESQFIYNKTFAEKHGVTAMAIGTLRDNVSTPVSSSLVDNLPFRNVSLSGNATYTFDQKYHAQFTFGYNASERFSEKFRWGFFPSIGLAWTVNKEKFMETLDPTISKLRFRFTHGLLGNDNISNERFFYLSDVDLDAPGGGYSFGIPTTGSNSVTGVSTSRYENPFVQWEISEQTNLGIDLGLFNNALTFTGDYYRQYRNNIVQTRALPASNGLQAPVLANVGKYKSSGFDAELAYNKSINADWWLQGRSTFTYTTGEYVCFEEPTLPYPYLSRIGLNANQVRGYIAERLFIDDEEVLNSPRQEFGGQQVLGGDIKYVDVNKDGVVNSNDIVPIGYPTIPEITYGFGLSVGYKSFDLSFFFSGIARTSLFINPSSNTGTAPFGSITAPNAVLQAWADSHWTEEHQDVYAQWPRLSQNPTENNMQTSTYWMRDGSMLRLKQAEIGCNLKGMGLEKINIQNLRIYISGTNLLNFSRFKLWDPEMGGNGLAYPLQRVFNFGMNFNL